MTTTKKEQTTWAMTLLEGQRARITAPESQLIISQTLGTGLTDYLRVFLVFTDAAGRVQTDNLTWGLGHALGYSLRDRAGQWHLAISGYGYSKPLDVAIALARFYGLQDYALRFTTI